MKRLLLILLCCPLWLEAQNTINADGSWSNTGIWSGGNVADMLAENVTIQTDRIVTLSSLTVTVGNVQAQDRVNWTIGSGGIIDIGESGNPRNFTATNDVTVTINSGGQMIVWGDFNVNVGLELAVAGTLIIKGSLNMTNDAVLNLSGNVTIEGDFVASERAALTVDGNLDINGNLQASNDLTLDVDGSVDVAGNIDVGERASATGTGSVTSGGCSVTDGSSFCTSGPLPIELLSFKVEPNDNTVVISWATASELNNDFFTLERSSDGTDFQEIARMRGAGNSEEVLSYQFIDIRPIVGIAYYRLTQTDFDGTSETFPLASVTFGDLENAFSAYPNPASLSGFMVLNQSDSEGSLSIFDTSGRLMHSDPLPPGQNLIDVNLSAGVYILQISNPTGRILKTDRMLVQE
ncbi:MAG: T9SS type A sorting domain-containing protein [Bacteroidota bacterium]